MGKLDPNSPRAPYLQVADSVLRDIRDGEYKPGDPLPSYQALAHEYGVAVGTVKNAFALLRERGVVVTRHGSGSSVHSDLDPATLSNGGPPDTATDMRKVLALLDEIRERLRSIEAKLSAD